MSWSINEVARLAGLTSRTLRHYHAIGLLEPAGTDDGGRRRYAEAQLLRLQEILVLRELGLGLHAIAAVLASPAQGGRVAVLQGHLERLEAERQRYDRLIATVRQTISSLKTGASMTADEMFTGLIHNPYEAEARERWGDAAVDAANDRLRRLGQADRELLTSGRGFQQVHERLAALKAAGLTPADPRVQEVIDQHYRVVSLAWTPSAEAYLALGEMYVADERFRKNIGQGDDSLVEYLRDAMRAYAASALKA